MNSINSNVDLTGLSKQDALAAGEIAGGILGVVYTIVAIIYVLEIIGMWKIFVKAGIAGWKSIIPIYNLVLLFKLSGESPWLILLFFVPIANLYPALHQPYKLAKSFGKGIGCTLALIFFPGFAYMYLGLGKAEYVSAGGNE